MLVYTAITELMRAKVNQRQTEKAGIMPKITQLAVCTPVMSD